jgi:hypothetical protein
MLGGSASVRRRARDSILDMWNNTTTKLKNVERRTHDTLRSVKSGANNTLRSVKEQLSTNSPQFAKQESGLRDRCASLLPHHSWKERHWVSVSGLVDGMTLGSSFDDATGRTPLLQQSLIATPPACPGVCAGWTRFANREKQPSTTTGTCAHMS